MNRATLLALALAATLTLSACTSDCGPCSDPTNPIRQVIVNLCASEVPDPTDGEVICAEPTTIQYRITPSNP